MPLMQLVQEQQAAKATVSEEVRGRENKEGVDVAGTRSVTVAAHLTHCIGSQSLILYLIDL